MLPVLPATSEHSQHQDQHVEQSLVDDNGRFQRGDRSRPSSPSEPSAFDKPPTLDETAVGLPQKHTPRGEWINGLLSKVKSAAAGTPPNIKHTINEDEPPGPGGGEPNGAMATAVDVEDGRQSPAGDQVSPSRDSSPAFGLFSTLRAIQSRLQSRDDTAAGVSQKGIAPPSPATSPPGRSESVPDIDFLRASITPGPFFPHRSPPSIATIADSDIDPVLLNIDQHSHGTQAGPQQSTSNSYPLLGFNGQELDFLRETQANMPYEDIPQFDSNGVPTNPEARRIWWMRGGHNVRPAHFTFDQDGRRVDVAGRELDQDGFVIPVQGPPTISVLRREHTLESSDVVHLPPSTVPRPPDETAVSEQTPDASQSHPANDPNVDKGSISPQFRRREDQAALMAFRAKQARPWRWPRRQANIIFDVSSKEANERAQPSIEQTITKYAKHVVRKWAKTGIPELAKIPMIWAGEGAPLKPLPEGDRRPLDSRLDSLEENILDLLQKRRRHGEEEIAYLKRVEELLLAEEDLSEERLEVILRHGEGEESAYSQEKRANAGGQPSGSSLSRDDAPSSSRLGGVTSDNGKEREQGQQDEYNEGDANHDLLFYTLLSDSVDDPELQDQIVDAFRGMAPRSAFDFSLPADQDLYLDAPCNYLPEEEFASLVVVVESSIKMVLSTLLAARVKGVKRVRQGKEPRGWGSIFAAAALVLPKEIVLAAQESHRKQFAHYPSGRIDPDELEDRIRLAEEAAGPNLYRARGDKLKDLLYDVTEDRGSDSEAEVEGEIGVVEDADEDEPEVDELEDEDEEEVSTNRPSVAEGQAGFDDVIAQRAAKNAMANAKAKALEEKLAAARTKHSNKSSQALEAYKQYQARQAARDQAAAAEAAEQAESSALLEKDIDSRLPPPKVKKAQTPKRKAGAVVTPAVPQIDGTPTTQPVASTSGTQAFQPEPAVSRPLPTRPTWKTTSSPIGPERHIFEVTRKLPRPPSPPPLDSEGKRRPGRPKGKGKAVLPEVPNFPAMGEPPAASEVSATQLGGATGASTSQPVAATALPKSQPLAKSQSQRPKKPPQASSSQTKGQPEASTSQPKASGGPPKLKGRPAIAASLLAATGVLPAPTAVPLPVYTVKKKLGRPTNAVLAARRAALEQSSDPAPSDSISAIINASIEQRRQSLSGSAQPPSAEEKKRSPERQQSLEVDEIDELQSSPAPPVVTPKKRGRPSKASTEAAPESQGNEGEPESTTTVAKKRARPPKSKDAEAPIPQDHEDEADLATPARNKRGRPPKAKDPSQDELDIPNPAAPTPKKRGRPPKDRAEPVSEPQGIELGEVAPAPATTPTPKKRGRPPKVKPLTTAPNEPDTASALSERDAGPSTTTAEPASEPQGIELGEVAPAPATTPTPKKRGRPPKVKPTAAPNEPDTASTLSERDAGPSTATQSMPEASDPVTPKRRGRPSKRSLPASLTETPDRSVRPRIEDPTPSQPARRTRSQSRSRASQMQ